MPERLQRRRTPGWKAPEGAKYVGRGTKYGNPNRIVPTEDGWSVIHDNGGAVGIFGVKADAHRFAVEAYRHHLATHPEVAEAAVTELTGRDLLCWCPANLPCHGDLLLELVEFKALLSQSSLGAPAVAAIAALTSPEDLARLQARRAERASQEAAR